VFTPNTLQANVAETGEVVAIKKVYQDKRYKNRELQIMKELYHPNVITLRHAFYTQGDKVSSMQPSFFHSGLLTRALLALLSKMKST